MQTSGVLQTNCTEEKTKIKSKYNQTMKRNIHEYDCQSPDMHGPFLSFNKFTHKTLIMSLFDNQPNITIILLCSEYVS